MERNVQVSVAIRVYPMLNNKETKESFIDTYIKTEEIYNAFVYQNIVEWRALTHSQPVVFYFNAGVIFAQVLGTKLGKHIKKEFWFRPRRSNPLPSARELGAIDSKWGYHKDN